MEHIGTTYLKSKYLILRRFTVEDAEAMFANWASDPEVTRFLTWQPHESIEDSQRSLNKLVTGYERADFYFWGIEIRGTGILIGSIEAGIKDDENGIVLVACCLGKNWWGQGYVAEALSALVRFFFEEVGANRIEARHDLRNPNSGRVMQKAGLRYEGTSLEAYRNNQGIADLANYAILARD
jgi:ribosomal-protein-alanine N-acetyltransferase